MDNAQRQRSEMLLDDGEFYVWMASSGEPQMGVAYLERRCGLNRPEVIGSAEVQAGGGWMAAIAASARPPQMGFNIVARNVPRLDAIHALWRNRHDAWLNTHSIVRPS